MNAMKRVVLVLAALILSTLTAAADDTFAGSKVSSLSLSQKLPADGSGSGDGLKTGKGDEQLATRLIDFERFAQRKIQEFNRNHKLSRSRMQINKQPDGLFRAVFHQIDSSSLAYKVSRSQSKGIPYVGVLSYQEHVFEGFGATPDECRKGNFSPVSVIPNRHIFSYRNGAWN